MLRIRKQQYELTIDTLTDIMASVVEHREQLDLTCILNFVDHYRVYIKNFADKESSNARPIDFESFINDQTLLNAAAALISIEAGELVVAPDALINNALSL